MHSKSTAREDIAVTVVAFRKATLATRRAQLQGSDTNTTCGLMWLLDQRKLEKDSAGQAFGLQVLLSLSNNGNVYVTRSGLRGC